MSRFESRYGASGGQDAVIKRVELKWFDPIRGFGFVSENANSPNDIFMHGSALQRAGNPRVYPGAEMECEVVPGQRGEQVERVIQIYSYGDRDAVGQGGGRQAGRGDDADESGDRFSPNYGGGYQQRQGAGKPAYGQRDGGPARGRDNFRDRDGGGNNRFNSPRPPQRPRAPEVVPPYYPTGEEQELIGHLKWFKELKGFGFAIADGVEQEIFIHRTALVRSGIAAIAPGQRLKMLVRKAERGLEAMLLELLPGSVIPVAPAQDAPAGEADATAEAAN